MVSGTLSKMRVEVGADKVAQYFLRLGDQEVPLNAYIGKTLKLEFSGSIYCKHCGQRTPKSYSQGYCFKHAGTLAAADLCIVRPETCHHHLGTCREPEWGLKHCMIPHTVYLANSSGLKVGITRQHQQTTRWLDQGASQAMPILQVNKRLDAGRVEAALREHFSDKTDWRKLLKGDAEPLDLKKEVERVVAFLPEGVEYILEENPEEFSVRFPVEEYPEKIKSHNFDKEPVVEGVLRGIKGQYLIFDNGVINIRKFTSYDVAVADAKGASKSPTPSQNVVPKGRDLSQIARTGPYGAW